MLQPGSFYLGLNISYFFPEKGLDRAIILPDAYTDTSLTILYGTGENIIINSFIRSIYA